MDTEQDHRDLRLASIGPLWSRLLLLAALFALGIGYLVSFGWLRAHSNDFIAQRRNADAAQRALALDPALPQQLEFATEQPALALLGSGWHVAEPDGVWSWHREAVLQLHLPQTSQALLLRLEALAYISRKRPRQQLTVLSGTLELGRASASLDNGRYQLELAVPAALQGQATLPLTLRVDRTGSPFRDNPAVRDSRQLGLKLLRMQVVAAGAGS